MDKMAKPTIRKSKLVTLCSTDNNGFAPMYPSFTYKGGSRSGKAEVEVTFPSYKENLMFYEHFNACDDVSPSILSFVYLGGNGMGEVSYNFRQYQSVIAVDFSKQFATVNSIFHIVKQLPKCRELRIYLSTSNIWSSKDEQLLMEQIVFNTFYQGSQYASETLKTLKIIQDEEMSPEYWQDLRQTRLYSILAYAFKFLPKLECFTVEGLYGDGKVYDLLHKFCESMKNMPKHEVRIINGKATCKPQPTVSAITHQSPPDFLSPPLKSPTAYECSSSNSKKIFKGEAISNEIISPHAVPTSHEDPRVLKRKFADDLNKKTIFSPEPIICKEKDTEIVEVPPPPKMDPITINLSDEDENDESLPKQMKMDRLTTCTVPPSPQSSVCSNVSTSACSSITIRMDQNQPNSLTSISSEYNEWEVNSSDEEEQKQSIKTNQPIFNRDVVAKVAETISPSQFHCLNSIIHSVTKADKSGPSKKASFSDSRKKNLEFKEGIHFDRRKAK